MRLLHGCSQNTGKLCLKIPFELIRCLALCYGSLWYVMGQVGLELHRSDAGRHDYSHLQTASLCREPPRCVSPILRTLYRTEYGTLYRTQYGTVHCTVRVQYTVRYSVRYSVPYSVRYTVYSVRYTVRYSVRYNTLYCTEYGTVYRTQYGTIHCTVLSTVRVRRSGPAQLDLLPIISKSRNLKKLLYSFYNSKMNKTVFLINEMTLGNE